MSDIDQNAPPINPIAPNRPRRQSKALAPGAEVLPPRVKRPTPLLLSPELPEPMMLVCVVVCRSCRNLVPVGEGLAATVTAGATATEDSSESATNGSSVAERSEGRGFTNPTGVAKCSVCQENTPIRPAPEGKHFYRCLCGCLIVAKWTAKRVTCPRETCKRLIEPVN